MSACFGGGAVRVWSVTHVHVETKGSHQLSCYFTLQPSRRALTEPGAGLAASKLQASSKMAASQQHWDSRLMHIHSHLFTRCVGLVGVSFCLCSQHWVSPRLLLLFTRCHFPLFIKQSFSHNTKKGKTQKNVKKIKATGGGGSNVLPFSSHVCFQCFSHGDKCCITYIVLMEDAELSVSFWCFPLLISGVKMVFSEPIKGP